MRCPHDCAQVLYLVTLCNFYLFCISDYIPYITLYYTYLTINNLMSQMNVVRQRRGYVVDKNIGDLLSSISVVLLMQLVYLALYI